MGYDSKVFEIQVNWRVSRHNSRNDQIDDLLTEQLREELEKLGKEAEKIIEKPDYARLQPWIIGGSGD